MLIEEFYHRTLSDKACKTVLKQMDWFASNVRFDPLSGEALPELLTNFLRKVAHYAPSLPYRDRVSVIIDGCEDSLRHLMGQLNEEPRRQLTDMPYWKARELDTSSFISLSRRPGRTLREKLAGKPNIKAVKHYLSVDTTENRLLKALVLKLSALLELRHGVAGKSDYDGLKDHMYLWLGTDEAQGIGRWENQPPNNTLLGHRDYRRLWRAWQALQCLEDNIDLDIQAINARKSMIEEWTNLANLYSVGNHVFPDVPILPVFEDFVIKTLTPSGWKSGVRPRMFKENRRTYKEVHYKAERPVCIDPGYFQPRYSVEDRKGILSDLFIEQFWLGFAVNSDISSFSLNRSDCIIDTKGVDTFTYPDLLYAESVDKATGRNASAHIFARRLAEIFKTPDLVWLSPDFRDDFSLELVRKSLNARFARATPLPRSVAAVFENVPYSAIKEDGYKVAVYEPFKGKLFRTLLIARYSQELHKAIPQTRGFRWQKQVTEVTNDPIPQMESICGFWVWKSDEVSRSFNDYGTVCKGKGITAVKDIEADRAFLLQSSPVTGGLALHVLQKQAPEVPLWQNAIPELMIKAVRGGLLSSVYLVNADIAVSPIPGKSVNLPIKEHFTLPAGKAKYRFRLYKGSKSEAIGYQMKLESRQLPFSEDVDCELIMSYTYGADNPFRLEFRPLKKQYKPIVAEWIPLEEVEDAIGPTYPTATTWEQLKHYYNPKKQKYSNIQDWLSDGTERLCELIQAEECSDIPQHQWKTGVKNQRYTHIDDTYAPLDKASNLVRQNPLNFDIHYYSKVSGPLGPVAWWLSKNSFEYNATRTADICHYIRKALIFPYCKLWADGFIGSQSDNKEISAYILNLQKLFRILYDETLDERNSGNIRNNVYKLLCIANCDIEDQAIREQIKHRVWTRSLSSDAVGFYLGTLRGEELRDTLAMLYSNNDSYVLFSVSKAAWRNPYFIKHLSAKQLETTADMLNDQLPIIFKQLKERPTSEVKRDLGCLLELLLALLRTRESSDYEIRSMFQPSKQRIKLFSSFLEELIIYLLKNDIKLRFRVDIEVKKEEQDPTPSFLYALRCFLEGDDNSQGIRVTGITEDI